MSDHAEFTYVGGELELFAQAENWKQYWSSKLQPELRGDVLEVGAGIGSNTVLLRRPSHTSWTCLEPDRKLVGELRRRVGEQQRSARCDVVEGTITDLNPGQCFDSIIYIDVLEHISDDAAELARAAERLRPGGRVMALSPAHQWLFSKFDESIGHCRRYSRATLLAATPASLRVRRCFYLDCFGLFLSLANRLLLRQSLPTVKQIRFWDRVVVPVSRVFDPLLGFHAGKSIVGIWEKPMH